MIENRFTRHQKLAYLTLGGLDMAPKKEEPNFATRVLKIPYFNLVASPI